MDLIQKDENCCLCGKNGRTKKIKGRFYHATCEAIRRHAMIRPELMLQQIREFHPELVESAPVVAKDRVELNAELGAANIRLVQKLREVDEENTEFRRLLRHALDIPESFDIMVAISAKMAVIDELNFTLQCVRERINVVDDKEIEPKIIRMISAGWEHGEKISDLKARLDYVKNTTASDDDTCTEHLDLKGELEGLQDVLASLEQERATMHQERVRLSDQVRWLHEQLATTERKADGLEKEVDRLQESLAAANARSQTEGMFLLRSLSQHDIPFHISASAEARAAFADLRKSVDGYPPADAATGNSTIDALIQDLKGLNYYPARLADAERLAAADDPINQPRHYTSHPSGIECIQITEHMGFTLGNAVKYIWRADLKANAIEDLKKAQWYINREMKKRGEMVGSWPASHEVAS